MEKVLVSVAMCTYNGEKYLKTQLDSILKQTYSPIELIIVDDNSRDGTRDLLIPYQKKHNNIHVYFNETNLGYNKNFEKAISYCKGEFISISDQDDIWLPDKIEKLANAIGENWVIVSDSLYIDSDDRLLDKTLLDNFSFQNTYKSILLENFVTGHTSLLSRKILEYIFPIPAKGFYDWWIGFIAIYHNKLVYLDQKLTYYRIHSNSVIQQALADKVKKINPRGTLSTQLRIFLSYKNLKPADRDFVTYVKENVDDTRPTLLNPLFPFLLKNFGTYFPRKGNKSIFSKLNFLRKFLKTY